ncbi:MAG: hypothetical protein IJ794_16700 [Lachnospiraceae bacterium]|nr:hypothetical protein [Lachnospiraceae bacterium]
MPHISPYSRKCIIGFLCATGFTVVLHMFTPSVFPARNISSHAYCAIIIAWMLTIRRRITQKRTRLYLMVGGLALLLLFLLRLMRWCYFAEAAVLERSLWYAYYIPFTLIPMLSLFLALGIGHEEEEDVQLVDWIEAGIVVFWFWLQIAVLTNDLHQRVFIIHDYGTDGVIYSHGIGYYLIVVWCVLLTLTAFSLLVARCRVSGVRKLWWVPVSVAGIGVMLLVFYYLNGASSPVLFGIRLYNIQEAYAFLFIGMWEAGIQICLIPSNSDYDKIFSFSGTGAALMDQAGQIRFASVDWSGVTAGQSAVVGKEPVWLDENRKLSAKEIPGGKILWIDDFSTVNELNAELRDTLLRISEENTLLEMEHEIITEKLHLEAQNRIYDSIAQKVARQLDEIEKYLDSKDMLRCVMLGAYVKRRSNLELMTRQRTFLEGGELVFSIRESLENIMLGGKDCLMDTVGMGVLFPGNIVISAYEYFQEAMEQALPGVSTVSVLLSGENGLRMDILLDTPSALPERTFEADTGIQIAIMQEQEGTYLRFAAERKGGRL